MYDKVKGFTKKCDEKDMSYFPLLEARLASSEMPKRAVFKTVKAHLYKLRNDLIQYFQDFDKNSNYWERNQFIIGEISKNLPILQSE